MSIFDYFLSTRLRKRIERLESVVARLQKTLAKEVKAHDELKLKYQKNVGDPIKGIDVILEHERYWVVTQGGFYEIKGTNLKYNASEVTKRAFKNGFVVDSRHKAEELFRRLKNLVE